MPLVSAKSPFWKSWCGQSLAVWVDGAVEHEADHGKGDHSLGHLWQVLVVPGQPAPTPEPAECALDDPAARQKDKALCSPGTADDKQRKAEQEAGGIAPVRWTVCRLGGYVSVRAAFLSAS